MGRRSVLLAVGVALLAVAAAAASGSGAFALTSSSAGAATVPLPAGLAVNEVTCAPSSQDCWATASYSGRTNGAVILFSSDGGAGWAIQWQAANTWADANAIACASASFCMASVAQVTVLGPQQPPAGVLATYDGGAHWRLVAAPAAGEGVWMACPAVRRCFMAAGVTGTTTNGLFETSDGGGTWSPAPGVPAGDLSYVTCADPGHCWAAGAVLARTVDGGATWTQLQYPAGPQPPFGIVITGLSFVNDREGWASSGTQCGGGISCPGYIYHTLDGGLTWQLQQSFSGGPYLTGISCSAVSCAVVGQTSMTGVWEALTFAGTQPAHTIAGSSIQAGALRSPVCESWGCLFPVQLSPGDHSEVLTTRPVAAVLAEGRRTWLTDVIPTFRQVSWKAQDVGRSVLVVLGLLLLVGFPGQLFNSTLMANYEDVAGWFDRPRRALAKLMRIRAEEVKRPAAPRWPPSWQVAGVFVLGGAFGALLDPTAGLNATTAETFLGILAASAFTTSVYTLVHALALHRLTGLRGHMRIYWVGIGIAAACLLVSRVTSAQPGYLYGVLLGYALGTKAELKKHHEGRLAAVGATAVLLASVSLWLLWTPVKAAADTNPTFLLETLSTAMAGVFLGGMTWLCFGMLPLRWLDGEKLFAWRRLLWTAAIGIGLFLFVHVVLWNAASTPKRTHSLVVMVSLFLVFAAISIGFWMYFNLRPQRAPEPEVSLIGSVALASTDETETRGARHEVRD